MIVKKTLITISLAAAMATVSYAGESSLKDLENKINTLEKKLKRLSSNQSKIKKATAKDNIKWSVDYRASYDNIDYKTASGKKPKNELLSSRLILGITQQPSDNLVFKAKLQMNKVFGHNNTIATNGFNNYDWFSSTTPDDNTLRVREAYFLYFGDAGEVPYSISVGRRPSINGLAGNLREDDNAASPLAHGINMEFDGASFNFELDKILPMIGSAFKICIGRGYSNANGKYVYSPTSMSNGAPSTTNDSYARNDDTPDMDLVGFIAKIYDDAQYKAVLNMYMAKNLLGIKDVSNFHSGFQDAGDMTGGTFTLMAEGIGDEISDFLDNTTFFASYAWSQTDPNAGVMTKTPMGNAQFGMLGSEDSKYGHSTYIGLQIPAMFTNEGKLGFEWNKGSKYWRSFTYGEDTLIGSKLAARGTATEVYYTQPMNKNLSFQFRYTKIKYDYTGSDMFFGASGNPMTMAQAQAQMQDPVSEASNLRAYVRYQF